MNLLSPRAVRVRGAHISEQRNICRQPPGQGRRLALDVNTPFSGTVSRSVKGPIVPPIRVCRRADMGRRGLNLKIEFRPGEANDFTQPRLIIIRLRRHG